MKKYFVLFFLISVVILMGSCEKNSSGPTGPSTPLPGATRNGNAHIMAPTYYDSVRVGNNFTIYWASQSIAPSSPVSIQLFRSDTLISTITSYTANDGSHTWYVNSLPSSENYRIRIAEYSDTSKWDFGAYFRIFSNYSGSITVTSPTAGDSATISSSMSISWAISGNIGSYAGIRLYMDTSFAYTIRSSQYISGTSGSYTWSNVQTPLGSSNRYRIMIYSTADSSIKTFSNYFTIRSQYYGSYTIINPTSLSTWAAGSTYEINWGSTGNPGSYTRIDLFRGDSLAQSLSTYQSNTGSYSWTLPAYQLSGRYRIKISSQQDPGIYVFSDTFSISGLTADAYENDNNRTNASSIVLNGTIQQRNITYSDTDWVSFQADSGKSYLIATHGTTPLYVYLYKGASTSYLTYFYNSTKSLVWKADAAGMHYVMIRSYYSGGYGDYGLSLTSIDSVNLVSFSFPAESSVITAGNTTTLSWKRDSLFFIGSYLYLHLYDDTTSLFSLSSSYLYSPNTNGTYSWSVPLGMVSGNRYRVRISDRYNPDISGYSDYFSINGIERDSFEIDNNFNQSKAIPTNGTIQSRTLSYGDTDWVSFQGKKDSLYVLSASGLYLSMNLFAGTQATLLSSASGLSPKMVWPCTSTANYKLRISQYSTSYSGQYNLSVREYSSNNMASFSAPTSYSTWSAGSSYTVQWTADTALFAQIVRLYLYRRGSFIYTLSSSTANDGTQSVVIPSGLASGNGYQVRIQANSNAQIFALSDSFSIAGVPGDIYEPDDTSSQASAIVIGAGYQTRSLTYQDKDYIGFTTQRNRLYRVETMDSLYPSISVYSADMQTLITSTNTTFLSPNPVLSWLSLNSTDLIILVTGNRTGSYRIKLDGYDSTQFSFTVNSPSAGATLIPQTPHTIQWTDNLAIGGSVDIFLYDGASVIETIATSINNNGQYIWTPSTQRAGGNNYTIRIISRINSLIYGLSGVFAISQ